MKSQKKVYLTKQKKKVFKELIKRIIDNYYLFIPTALLNEKIDMKEFQNKAVEMYADIVILKELKIYLEHEK